MSHNINIEPIILNHLPSNIEGLRILDCGLGHGKWGLIIRSQKEGTPYLVGVEPNQKYIKWAKKVELYNELHCMTGQEYASSHPETFDIILLCEVICHQPTKNEGYKLLKSLEKLLKRGGILFVSTPDGNLCFNGSDSNKIFTPIEDVRFTRSDLENLGYTVDITPTESYLNLGRVGPIYMFLYRLIKGKKIITHTLVGWKEMKTK